MFGGDFVAKADGVGQDGCAGDRELGGCAVAEVSLAAGAVVAAHRHGIGDLPRVFAIDPVEVGESASFEVIVEAGAYGKVEFFGQGSAMVVGDIEIEGDNGIWNIGSHGDIEGEGGVFARV